MYALLTDSDRFPFAPDEAERLAAAGLQLAELEGHDPAALVDAARGAFGSSSTTPSCEQRKLSS